MLFLYEVLGLELSNFSRRLKMEPGRDDNRHFMNDKSNDLWLRWHGNKGNEEEAPKSENGKALEVFRVMVLRTTPELKK